MQPRRRGFGKRFRKFVAAALMGPALLAGAPKMHAQETNKPPAPTGLHAVERPPAPKGLRIIAVNGKPIVKTNTAPAPTNSLIRPNGPNNKNQQRRGRTTAPRQNRGNYYKSPFVANPSKRRNRQGG